MRFTRPGAGELHLTYCSNVHPAETLDGIEEQLDRISVPVGRAISPSAPFGLGLWLSSSVIDELRGGATSRLRSFLDARDLYCFTLNAFPYRGFHEPRVKEKVFEPTWAEDARVVYTEGCGDVLAALLPEGCDGSISTAPLGLPVDGFDMGRAIANLRRVGWYFAELESRHRRRIVLSVEPEPRAILSTIHDAARFLDEELFEGPTDPLRRYIGVCFDTCHESVMHRDMAESLRELERRRVTIGKVQVTSALEIVNPVGNAAGRERLRGFDEGRYFHQTAYRDDRGAVHVSQDLAPFLAEVESGSLSHVARARVHFHVPVFAELRGDLRTTRAELAPFLPLAAKRCPHFEVETYTFDVIPPAEREALGCAGDLASLLTAELRYAGKLLDVPVG